MENEKNNDKLFEILLTITSIPKNLITIHGLENMTEFLLHNLSHKECFNFSKSAYFVDNPDFNFLKGIAGFDATQAYQPDRNHWQEQEAFSNHMKQDKFNNQVRQVCHCSIKKNGKSPDDVVQEIADVLQFENPDYLMWPVKYENQGLLVFEKTVSNDTTQHLENALHLFGFCPIF